MTIEIYIKTEKSFIKVEWLSIEMSSKNEQLKPYFIKYENDKYILSRLTIMKWLIHTCKYKISTTQTNELKLNHEVMFICRYVLNYDSVYIFWIIWICIFHNFFLPI